MIRVLIADKNYLSRVALELLVGELKGFELVPSVCGDKADLLNQLKLSKPNLVIADFVSLDINTNELKQICSKFNKSNFLVITDVLSKQEFSSVLESGITSYLLKDCDKVEILDAINSTIKNDKFICSKIISILTSAPEIVITN